LAGRQVLECLAQPRAEQLGPNGCGAGYGRGDSGRLAARQFACPNQLDPGDDGRLQSTDYANSFSIAFAQPCADRHADTFTFSDTQPAADRDTQSNRITHTIAFALAQSHTDHDSNTDSDTFTDTQPAADRDTHANRYTHTSAFSQSHADSRTDRHPYAYRRPGADRGGERDSQFGAALDSSGCGRSAYSSLGAA